jgi:hypothetical protein
MTFLTLTTKSGWFMRGSHSIDKTYPQYVGLKHFIKKIGVFGIERRCFDGVEDGGLFVDLTITKQLFL